MATNALFINGFLAVLDDASSDTITVGRNAAGTILLNGGAVPVLGGTPTVANTSAILVLGQGGDDTITLDESNGALPPVAVAGGSGDDFVTGGSAGDFLFGQAGNDTLLGKGGADLLFGGAGDDVLTGGDGDDQMFGEAGNDRMIWNPGDDSDLMEGGAGTDTAEVNGGNGAETFTIAANGARVRFDRTEPAAFSIDIGTTEQLVLNAGGGDDTISTTGDLAALISLTLDGGAGDDTIRGGNGVDLLIGGDGDDFIDGQQGNDTAQLGAGDDVFQWDPGDGSDIVEGGDGADTLLFNGSAGNEDFAATANGGRVLFTRNLGNIAMDIDDVETIEVNALGGTDNILVDDLTGTDVTQVSIDLAGTIGGTTGDAQIDTVTVNGTTGNDIIDIFGAGTSLSVVGLPALVDITNAESQDGLTVNGLDGDDTITATTLAAGIMALTLDGGTGNDTILGSQGADILIGGDGNDFVFGDNGNDTASLGAGDDVFEWDPGDGNDVVEGQDGTDTLLFRGANIAENINILANGPRALFTRDVANITMDLNDVEQIDFRALGGADSITIGDLSGTDVTAVALDLAGPNGGGDGALDTITANATNGADVIVASSQGSTVQVSGLAATVDIFQFEQANDKLVINGQGGDDRIDASGLSGIALTVNAGVGVDLIIGSNGNDLVNGGDGNDTAFLGDGDDTFVWNPGDDNDTIEGQAGLDTMLFNGAAIAENIEISANGGRALFFRDIASVTMDLDDVEAIEFNALGGADSIVVNDLSGTDVTDVEIDLAGTLGGTTGDGAVDTVTINATNGDDAILVTRDASGIQVFVNDTMTVDILGFEATDRLVINGLGGDDVIFAAGFEGILLTADGGAGNDILIGGDGADTLIGGDGDDILLGGPGVDILDGGPGDNIVFQDDFFV